MRLLRKLTWKTVRVGFFSPRLIPKILLPNYKAEILKKQAVVEEEEKEKKPPCRLNLLKSRRYVWLFNASIIRQKETGVQEKNANFFEPNLSQTKAY
jgi:hypothetical protein